jgi:nucleoid DNA-binding protein
MNKQEIIDKILVEIQKEFKTKYSLDISMEQIKLIVSVQNKLTANAVYTGKGIRLPNLGKLVIPAYKKKKMTDKEIIEQHKLQTNACLINRMSVDYSIGY